VAIGGGRMVLHAHLEPVRGYAARVTLLIGVLAAFLVGYVARRWVVLLLGPLAGAALVGVAAGQHLGMWDTPAAFVAAATTAALALGVLLGRSGRGITAR